MVFSLHTFAYIVQNIKAPGIRCVATVKTALNKNFWKAAYTQAKITMNYQNKNQNQNNNSNNNDNKNQNKQSQNNQQNKQNEQKQDSQNKQRREY